MWNIVNFATLFGGVLPKNVLAVLQGVQKCTFSPHKIYYILGKVRKFQGASSILSESNMHLKIGRAIMPPPLSDYGQDQK